MLLAPCLYYIKKLLFKYFKDIVITPPEVLSKVKRPTLYHIFLSVLFFSTAVVQPGCLTYRSPPISLSQSGHSPLTSLINKAFHSFIT